jgi:DNA invertase Pin-like site-specific DNA recombinase
MNGLKVIELIRVSTEGQAAQDRASIPAQQTVNRRTCEQYGLEIVRSIILTDVSGTSVLKAPEILELIDLMCAPEIHGVVTREFSRLMRPERYEDYALLSAFADSQTLLYLPEGPIDFNSKTGRLLGTIRAAMAGVDRMEILERSWTSKEEKRRRGELAQSRIVLPFGVGYEEGRGFSYKAEAERVREVFRRFLAGEHSYRKLAPILGLTSRSVHNVLRNPIWTGWRVIDKKRDMTGAGRYAQKNGRQADRRKIARAPDEIIRVQVIDVPLISDEDFNTVQTIMDRKQARHWRSRPEMQPRFTYNGFLTCACCGNLVLTAFARRDYYLCKGRRLTPPCSTKYMARERLERILDGLFSQRLTEPSFLQQCVHHLEERAVQTEQRARPQDLRLQSACLRNRRERVVDAYIEGVIDKHERDRRLANLDRDIKLLEEALTRETTPSIAGDLSKLTQALSVLLEWPHWSRDQKRLVLETLIPDIRVADFRVESVGFNPQLFSNEGTRKDRDSSLPRA